MSQSHSHSQPQAVFSDFMELAVFFYHGVGIEPYEPVGGKAPLSRWRYLNLWLGAGNLNFMLLMEIAFVYLAFRNSEHFIEATMILCYIGFVVVGEFKMFTVCWQRAKMSELVRQLESIFPRPRPLEQRQYRVQHYLHRCRLITQCFGGLYIMLIMTYSLSAIVQYAVQRWWRHLPNVEQVLPFVPTAPWNWHDHWSFYVMYTLQAVAGFFSATGHISSDLLIYAVITQLIMHFDYLTRSIEGYEVQAGRVRDGAAKDLRQLQQMIIYHNKLLDLTAAMNDVFGVPLLLNFLTSSVVVCFMGFHMSIGMSPEMCFKVALFLISSTVEIFLICYFSQLLNNSSSRVALAVYQMDWTSADLRYRRMLILMAQRAQRPVFLKATVFLDVSLSTMTDFMQMSYKFFALIRTMYMQ